MARWRYIDGINPCEAVHVRVDFDNGMSINFHNNWITPPDFEGPVDPGHEIVGAAGKVESDQQYRGFRWWDKGGGSGTKAPTARSHWPHRDEGDASRVAAGRTTGWFRVEFPVVGPAGG